MRNSLGLAHNGKHFSPDRPCSAYHSWGTSWIHTDPHSRRIYSDY